MKAMRKLALASLVILVASFAGLAQSNKTQQHRFIPIKAMSQEVEVLYGDPEKVGEPFVIRIRELPGGIAQTKATFEEQLIDAEKRVIWEAVAKKQIDVLQRSLANDYLDVSDVGVFTKIETIQLIPNLTLRDYSLNKFKVIKLNRNAGVITYEAIQHWTIKGQEAPTHVRATSVWINRGRKWLVAFHQESTIP